jgi:hypothetical protein
MTVCHVGETWGVQSLSMGSMYLASAQVSLSHSAPHKRVIKHIFSTGILVSQRP